MERMRRRAFLNTCFGGLTGMKLFLSAQKKKVSSTKPLLKKDESDVCVLVLGTAQDGGLPHIGCYCRNCLRARKERRFSRLISSLAIIDLKEKKSFLLDATPDIRVQSDIVFKRLGIERQSSKFSPDGILLTHAHIGHYTGLMFYGYEALSTHQLPVYCSSRMESFLVNNGPWSQLVSQRNINLQTLSSGQEISLTPQILISSFPVPHRDEYSDTLGFTISGKKKKLLYIPDIQGWDAWSCSIVKETKKVNFALLDGTFYSAEELPGRDLSKIGHPLIQTSLETLEEVPKVTETRVYFTHLNHTNPALANNSEASQHIKKKGFAVAAEGMEFIL